jgi:NAD(P)H dehydrogenase (quinone)
LLPFTFTVHPACFGAVVAVLAAGVVGVVVVVVGVVAVAVGVLVVVVVVVGGGRRGIVELVLEHRGGGSTRPASRTRSGCCRRTDRHTRIASVSANIAVIYAGASLRGVARAFAEAAEQASARTRVLRVPDDEDPGGHEHPAATLDDLVWADGVAVGTPVGPGRPSPALLGFIARAEREWSGADLFDKAVSIFTDEPEHYAADEVVREIYDALYQWGAVIVGPRATELALGARPRSGDDRPTADALPGPRLRTANYRARRLTALAGLLANERTRRSALEL